MPAGDDGGGGGGGGFVERNELASLEIERRLKVSPLNDGMSLPRSEAIREDGEGGVVSSAAAVTAEVVMSVVVAGTITALGIIMGFSPST